MIDAVLDWLTQWLLDYRERRLVRSARASLTGYDLTGISDEDIKDGILACDSLDMDLVYKTVRQYSAARVEWPDVVS